jgi:hypothetical protein
MYFNSNALTLTYYGNEKIKKIMGVTPPWTPLQGRGLPFAAPPRQIPAGDHGGNWK